MKFLSLIFTVSISFSLFMASFFANANEINELAATIGKKVNLKVSAIADSPIPGIVELYTDRGIFYASDDGSYFMQARIYNISDGFVDETENALKGLRVQGISDFSESVIEFKAKDEKYVVNIFTDATCGFCRKLHAEMKDYNDLGITIRYLAFPRAGLESNVYDDTVSIWCATDPQEAMNLAKAGKQVADAKCQNNVAEQFDFGRRIGINSTPNIVLPDGSLVRGYKPAADLMLDLLNTAS